MRLQNDHVVWLLLYFVLQTERKSVKHIRGMCVQLGPCKVSSYPLTNDRTFLQYI